MNDVLFRNARIPELDDDNVLDLLVSGGLIAQAGNIPPSFDIPSVDCAGLMLLPGAVDMHVHFRDPGATHKEDLHSGSMAAARGGVTTVADMPNNTPPVVTAAAFLQKAAAADAEAACDVLLYMALTGNNLDEIAAVSAHPRFAGIKVFLGATTGSMLCDIETVRRAADQLDCLFVFHAESEAVLRQAAAAFGPGASARDHLTLRPVDAATDAVRQVASVFKPGMRFHICHVSTTPELDIIATSNGITCEAAPHHLAFSEDMTGVAGDLAKMNPPLRFEADRAALFAALRDGRIDCLATDHAPHTLEEKSKPWPGAPSGVPGVETLVPWTLGLVQDGLIDIHDAMRLLSFNPAKILGLSDRGHIRPGMMADLMLWDPASRWMVTRQDIASKCGWNLFEGVELAGRPVHVYRGGTPVY